MCRRWGRYWESGANRSRRGSTFPTAAHGTQVARAPVGLQDRHNGGMAPPLSTGVVWTGASAPINSDAVRCTGRLASARLAGGRAQEGPEVCATTTYLHQGVWRQCSSGEGDGCAGCRQVQTG
ncbi:uncharacterized protein [Aegilops tauschii subsp. strangulata]|uniref:uncharacterized protein n=1 Tax=Aegilops tauschii subsp. strangulata TaxID=200361 RepID=UPI001ABD3A45|nr:uncharacterized protein LOC120965131 [Aegilops tauschii subsp. strangulata]